MSEATGKDALFFQIILTSMKNKPDVDWSVVAEKSGYKDAKTASTRFGQIMKKLTGVSAAKAMAGNGTVAKAAPKGRGAKKEVGSGTNTNPSKVAKRAPKKTKKIVEEPVSEEEEEEEDVKPVVDSQMDIVKEEEEVEYADEEQEEYASAEEDIEV